MQNLIHIKKDVEKDNLKSNKRPLFLDISNANTNHNLSKERNKYFCLISFPNIFCFLFFLHKFFDVRFYLQSYIKNQKFYLFFFLL